MTLETERERLRKAVGGSLATRKFKQWLEVKGMTQAEAAGAMGMNEEMLSRYLNGNHKPGLGKAKLVFDLTDGAVLPFDWLQ